MPSAKTNCFVDTNLLVYTVDPELQEESADYGYRYFDCLLIASALRADCGFFLLEDLQHKRQIAQLTILNPFLTSPDGFLPAE
jgi:predicted nucleic acid-binding protein